MLIAFYSKTEIQFNITENSSINQNNQDKFDSNLTEQLHRQSIINSWKQHFYKKVNEIIEAKNRGYFIKKPTD